MSESSFAIEMMSAKEMMVHPQNFRRHPESQRRGIRQSLEEFGWLQNVLWNRRTGYILDGHARIEEAARRGESVPVRVVDVSPKEERRIMVALSKTGEDREIDDRALRDILSEVALESEVLPPGWSENEMDELIREFADVGEEEEEEDEATWRGRGAMVDPNGPPDGVPLAAIRMVQLFLTQETIGLWQEQVAALSQYFELATTTDVVMAAVGYAYQGLCGPQEEAARQKEAARASRSTD